jgi:hypothetical protein
LPIIPFCSAKAFDPELLEEMSEAFTQACTTLGLSDRTNPLAEIVAHHIIQFAQCGIRTKMALYMRTIETFKANPQ